jgi:tetratricopeptide (TPR) repeat protein
LELDPNFAISYATLGEVYISKAMYREGLPTLETYYALSRGRAMSLALLGYAQARLGERSQALRILDQLEAASKERYTPAISFAAVYAGLGEKDQAFAWLEKAYGERTSRLGYLKVKPLWDPLRSDPRFADLVRRIGLPP